MGVRVKFCGLARPVDAQLAESLGAAYLGVVFAASPRRQDAETAERIWAGTRRGRVGVFVDPPTGTVTDLGMRFGLEVIQLHGDEDPDFCRQVREAGKWRVWKALRVGADGDVEGEVARYADAADGVLLEGLSASGRGGVGAAFDWSMVEASRRDWPRGLELILAGGLRPENVAEAIRRVRPDIVDVSSGVERAVGRKDPQKMRAFMQAVHSAG